MIKYYSNFTRLQDEIKILLDYSLSKYQFKEVFVEGNFCKDGKLMCRIELFGAEAIIPNCIAKYEAELMEGFYYEAERMLIKQLALNNKVQSY